MKFDNNENFNICSLCKGQCCKRMPGIVHPEQLQQPITKELLLKLYKEGYQFDYWEGDEFGGKVGYFLRPQTIKSKGVLVDPSWGGTCVFLITEQGCSKTFEERPYMCQQLEPQEDFNCGLKDKENTLNKYDYVLAWLQYNNLIEEIINDHNVPILRED